jgi:uncharacterized protein YndB with AHSA1/START domain
MCKTIKLKVKFNAPPRTVYTLLADSKQHSAFTGRKAQISKKDGGRFSADSGRITGVNVDLAPGKRIVQAWRRADFPEGVFSMATFNLALTADGGTELVLTHRGVPKHLLDDTEHEWRDKYWTKMKAYLARHNHKNNNT